MGIDYGHGQTNLDVETGIRYGIISMHDVTQAWCDSSEPIYPCKDCEAWNAEDEECTDQMGDCEPSSFILDDGEYQAESCFDGTEIMIYKSPYFTAGQYCSPCTPGAVNLNAAVTQIPMEKFDDVAYCFGHDWFDSEKAPYRVFEVATGKEVFAWMIMANYPKTNIVNKYHVQAKTETGSQLLMIPGIYEEVSEYFNNEILDRWELENYDPAEEDE